MRNNVLYCEKTRQNTQEKTQYINRKYKRDRLQRNKYCEKYRVKKCNKSQKKAQDIKRYRPQKKYQSMYSISKTK